MPSERAQRRRLERRVSVDSVPSAPTNVTATSFANTQSVVTWTAPASNGSTITKYTVTSQPGGCTCTTPGATTCTVSGLDQRHRYTFTVTATNGIGYRPASAPSAHRPRRRPPRAHRPASPPPRTPTPSRWCRGRRPPPTAEPRSPATPSPPAGVARPAPPATTSVHGHRADQRHQLHLHRHRHQRLGHRAGLGGLGGRHPGARRRAPPPACHRHLVRQQPVAVSWTAPASNGGRPITSYTVTSSTGGQTCTTTGHHHLHGHRPDQRHQLHLHRHRHQRRRDRAGLGGVGRRSSRRPSRAPPPA